MTSSSTKRPSLLFLFLAVMSTKNAIAADAKPLECRDRDSARKHFNRGLELYENKSLDAALPEIRRSREDCPTENNTLNLALLLRDLGRPVDAIDMLDELERDFPVLQPENEATAKALRKDLESIVGTVIFDGDHPGATIFIDGSSIGTLPMARPMRLPISMHSLRVEKSGYTPFETTFVVEPRNKTLVTVTLVPIAREPPKRPKIAKHALRFDAAVGLSPTLGGQVADCGADCASGPGLGTILMGGYRGLLISSVRLGAVIGYEFLWQHREGKLPDPPVYVNDELFVHAFFAAPQISAEYYLGAHRFDTSFALGIIGGPLVNSREPLDGRSFVLDSPSTPSTGFVGVMTFLQASWHSPWLFLGRWPMQVTLGVQGIARVSPPLYEETFHHQVANVPDKFRDSLLGSWVFTFTPGIAIEYDL
jgi:hypothetical protein